MESLHALTGQPQDGVQIKGSMWQKDLTDSPKLQSTDMEVKTRNMAMSYLKTEDMDTLTIKFTIVLCILEL